MTKETPPEEGIIRAQVDAVTRETLRAIAVGQQFDFSLPGQAQFESARSACTQMKMEGRKFTTRFTGDIEADRWSILIKRIE